MNLSNEFLKIYNDLVPDPTPLSKGEVVEEIVVSDVTEPAPYGDSAPAFLVGKHYAIVTGERNGVTVQRVVLAERMKVAWENAGITPTAKKVGNVTKVDMPDVSFSANGYNQIWTAL